MFENKYINKVQLLSKIKPLIASSRLENQFTEADYYKEEVRKQLNSLYGNDALYKDGLIIKTSIDTSLQKILDKVLINGLINQDKKSGWRGPLVNNLQNINLDIISKDYKNPFIKKWQIYECIKVLKNSIEVVDRNDFIYNIDLNSKENIWLNEVVFKKKDIFFGEKISSKIVIRQIPKVNGAMVAIDPHTGKILALSGGFSFKLSEFNRATQAKRQTGSAFKPFVYISAIKEGYSPATMRTGIEKSRNLMTIRLSDKIGMDKILKTAKNFKIDDYLDRNLSMSLGSGSVSLINLTNAYAMIVNGGKEIEPTLIVSVYNKAGKQIVNKEIKKCNNCFQKNSQINYDLPKILSNQKQILDSRIAYQITSMLEGVVLRGTGRKISSLNVPLGGKTGTTNDNKDAWFVGFSPDLAIGVYVGFDRPKSLGYKQTGSAVAVPIFKNFIKEASINSNKIPFRIPSGLSFVKIDPNTGLVSNDVDAILEPFIIGNEPYNKESVKKLDSLSSINNNSISGTGSLLNQ